MTISTRRLLVAVTAAFTVAAILTPAARPSDAIDLGVLSRLREEATARSQVMDTASYLTDVYGPRLTGSPTIRQAAEWTMNRMREWGLTAVHLESFPFGRGWQNHRFVAQMVAPHASPLIGFPKAWTPGTKGPVTADAVLAVIARDEDFAKYHGTLAGKIVLSAEAPDVAAVFTPRGRRYTDDDLARITRPPQPRPRATPNQEARNRQAVERKKPQFFLDEGVVAVVEPSPRGSGGTVFVQGGGSRDPKAPPVPPEIVLAVEHYNRIVRLLEKNIPVSIQLDVENQFYDDTLDAFNIIGELAGTDKADEVVMIGAHFDSWQSGTGATDNAAGSAVMLEAMRLLKATGVQLRRTVRIGLWSGEEEGLLGSRAYVTEHFADRDTMALKSDHAKFAGYLNVDNGTGLIRGVYMQGNDAVRPIFERWMEPLHDGGMTTLTIRNTGGTDHLSFDRVGLPGFQFIQDEIEYNALTHHSNMDTYDRLQQDDMQQNAVIVAWFALNAANRDDRLPRKPLPPPSPPQR
jgi:carboxypeptidase Q